MINKLKIISLIITLMAMMLISVASPPDAASAQANKPTPIHLKIDKYSILYTKPRAPFLDGNNRLLIPLRSIQDLMGGAVSYDPQSKTAIVSWFDHTFKLTIGSYNAYVDGSLVQMDTKPALIQGAMFLPMRLFLDQTDLSYTWNQKKSLLHLTDKRIVKGEVFDMFAGNDSADVKNEHAFDLLSYEVVQKNNSAALSINIKNSSGAKIEKGKSDIHPLIAFSNRGGFSTDSYSRPLNPPLQAVNKDETITFTQKIPPFTNVDYMISVGRELN
ncbi:copper amine oxidase N-terminal domain-containing protein [Paenibacillus herberti]|uniref:Copper amine oxidase-like N-terminal domain-containing protein n=1 Tax=Paenibacillus herberti TaxID=1619309 RepID=A0A229NYQ3_9BACL|nr:copper amine oxidase N-terminal domain-containing protein [Paenibacillus herberti]OXM14967.1 hypothetical protein CGZ75_19145 [Paenibacillus herberti]